MLIKQLALKPLYYSEDNAHLTMCIKLALYNCDNCRACESEPELNSCVRYDVEN